jgi:hypothetical protein
MDCVVKIFGRQIAHVKSDTQVSCDIVCCFLADYFADFLYSWRSWEGVVLDVSIPGHCRVQKDFEQRRVLM